MLNQMYLCAHVGLRYTDHMFVSCIGVNLRYALAFNAGVCLEVTDKIIQKGASHEGENEK